MSQKMSKLDNKIREIIGLGISIWLPCRGIGYLFYGDKKLIIHIEKKGEKK